jgi:hypothetical protein
MEQHCKDDHSSAPRLDLDQQSSDVPDIDIGFDLDQQSSDVHDENDGEADVCNDYEDEVFDNFSDEEKETEEKKEKEEKKDIAQAEETQITAEDEDDHEDEPQLEKTEDKKDPNDEEKKDPKAEEKNDPNAEEKKDPNPEKPVTFGNVPVSSKLNKRQLALIMANRLVCCFSNCWVFFWTDFPHVRLSMLICSVPLVCPKLPSSRSSTLLSCLLTKKRLNQ